MASQCENILISDRKKQIDREPQKKRPSQLMPDNGIGRIHMQDSMEKLQQNILHEINLRHREMSDEMYQMRQDLIGEFRRELSDNFESIGKVLDDHAKVSKQHGEALKKLPPGLSGRMLPEFQPDEQPPCPPVIPAIPVVSPAQQPVSGGKTATATEQAIQSRFTQFKVGNTQELALAKEADEEVEPQKSQPQGEFKGRPNLWGFLQAKQWDSVAAMDPDKTFGINTNGPYVPPKNLWESWKKMVFSSHFDLVIGTVIMANSVAMGLQLEYEGKDSADAIGIDWDGDDWPAADEAFPVLDHVFALIFIFELVARLSVMRCKYFKEPFNWMDTFIVITSIVELYLIHLIGPVLPDLTVVRLLRVLKIIRVLRILRVLKFFGKLRQLISAIVCSGSALWWSMLLLGIIQLIFAIFMTMSLQSFLRDESQDQALRKQIFTFFGTFSRSCITLFEMTLAAGTWGRVGRVVIFEVNRNYAIFFMGYLCFVSFGMMRVVGAIFLKETLAAAEKDQATLTSMANRDQHYVAKVRQVFNKMDDDGNGILSLDELVNAIEDEEIISDLAQVGIVAQEVPGMFTLMDDGDDEITFAEFLTGTMRLKNANKGVDLATLLYENKKLLKRVLVIHESVDKLRCYLGEKKAEDWALLSI